MNEHKSRRCDIFEKFWNDSETPIADNCPLTNSSHEKALVRVVEIKHEARAFGESGTPYEVIQSLCICGKKITERQIIQ